MTRQAEDPRRHSHRRARHDRSGHLDRPRATAGNRDHEPVGYATRVDNSGPPLKEISAGARSSDRTVVSVLSGNRNLEGRINTRESRVPQPAEYPAGVRLAAICPGTSLPGRTGR
ncbi:hypothetical protein V5P93_004651 [Actinokineospora auranticolor]|uniref:Uncharacterized protein n=1 Tax=Actinokineospora auranticolor TaxID=155976 RepID=A0A2S6GBK8_9PSEU|nr:hypothetical protein [Actinokineospora auranticolor]PPK61475.1 hypothetical protein CLV40_14125 [Actinokineospora auranticolor]